MADAILAADGFVDYEGPSGRLSNRGVPYHVRHAGQPTSDDYDDRGLCRFDAMPSGSELEDCSGETPWDAVARRGAGRYEVSCILSAVVSHERFHESWSAEERRALVLLADGGARDDVAALTGLAVRRVAGLTHRAKQWIRDNGGDDE